MKYQIVGIENKVSYTNYTDDYFEIKNVLEIKIVKPDKKTKRVLLDVFLRNMRVNYLKEINEYFREMFKDYDIIDQYLTVDGNHVVVKLIKVDVVMGEGIKISKKEAHSVVLVEKV